MFFSYPNRLCEPLIKPVMAVVLFVSSFASYASAEQALEDFTIKDIRGMRYCEFLLIYDDRVVIYNTTGSSDCSEDKWQSLDVTALAKENDAKNAQLNGPKYWAMDAQTLELGDKKSFGGIDARYAATLPISALGAGEGSDPYVGFTSSKKQTMVFEAGKPMYELVDDKGNTYVLNAYGSKVRDGDPGNLADQLSPADGWRFEIITPEKNVIVEASTDAPVQMVGDDLHQYYTLFDKNSQ